jgi:hypothetical protein
MKIGAGCQHAFSPAIFALPGYNGDMSKRKLAIIAVSLAALVLAGVLLYLLFLQQLLTPVAPTPPSAVAPKIDEDGYFAGAEIFLAAESAGAGELDRVEVTLVGASVTKASGKTFPFFPDPAVKTGGSVKVVLRPGSVQKILSDLMPQGRLKSMTLTFSPSARFASKDGSVVTAFLPNRTMVVPLDVEAPASRSLAGLLRLPIDGKTGLKNEVATFELPAELTAETTVLGGAFNDTRSRGALYQIQNPTLLSVMKAVYGIDLSPRAATGGSGTFIPPSAPPTGTSDN